MLNRRNRQSSSFFEQPNISTNHDLRLPNNTMTRTTTTTTPSLGPTSNVNSYYDLLGVSPTATAEELKVAYHRLARQYHPDKQQSQSQSQSTTNDNDNSTSSSLTTSSLFIEIQKAYECLRSESSRAVYDEGQRLLSVRKRQAHHKALLLDREDCRWERVTVDEQEEIDEDSTDNSQEEEAEMEWMLVYTCRCGSEVDVTPSDDNDDEEAEDDPLIDCPNCSLVYNITKLKGMAMPP